MRRWWAIPCLAVGATLPMACNALVGDYQVAPGGEAVSSAHLCDVERATFTFDLDLESTAQQPDLETYYEIANPELITHLTAMAQSHSDGDSGAGVTYIMGAAGVGKSFAVRNVLDGFVDTDKCAIDLADLFGDDVELLDFTVVQSPDLATLDGQVAFNELPSMADPAAFELTSLFTAAGCEATGSLVPLIVIDDLDEIHDVAATAILRAVDQFILDGGSGPGSFVHFVVVGRPEGFYTWLTDPDRTEDNNAILEAFTLAAPRYQTAGDLDFRVRGYLDFTGQLEGLETNGELDGFIDSVVGGVASNPFLTYSMGNLAVGNVAIEHTRPEANGTEPLLKAGLFDDIIQRAAQSHGRPEGGTELGGPYLNVLEDIAVHYVAVSDDGTFAVRSEDTLPLHDTAGSVLGEVRVRDVLNRAGVALLTSANATSTRYRFDPFWIHPHLVERYNQRTVASYVYRTCE
ncbi:MAG: hypothetical protein JRI68_09590 [Deltaproteobacteria bacterium]|nr:hypothetical protein [Deltaproteobacteria bacterium]